MITRATDGIESEDLKEKMRKNEHIILLVNQLRD
jgi:hypothetical protein